MNIIQKPITFLKEVKVELGKVSWPTRQELTDSTIVVIIATALVGLFIALIDVPLSTGLSILFK